MKMFVLAVFSLVIIQISGVAAELSDDGIIGMAVAACAAVTLLSILIAMAVVCFRWKEWIRKWMRLKGKVRMPKSYFKKRNDAKRKLISGSEASQISDPNRPPLVQSVFDPDKNVEDWRRRTRQFPPQSLYEEKSVSVDLGEENDLHDPDDIEFTIETASNDKNETPNKSSYKLIGPKKTAVNGKPSLYDNADPAVATAALPPHGNTDKTSTNSALPPHGNTDKTATNSTLPPHGNTDKTATNSTLPPHGNTDKIATNGALPPYENTHSHEKSVGRTEKAQTKIYSKVAAKSPTLAPSVEDLTEPEVDYLGSNEPKITSFSDSDVRL